MRSWILALFLLITSFGLRAESSNSSEPPFRLATFSADVTPPIGHMLFTGHWLLSKGVDSPLEARGFVLIPPGNEKPVVYCAVDWSEIRNDAYDRWRDVLAEAAGTVRERVLVSSVHQHDTPLADLEAERIRLAAGSPHQVIDLDFHEKAVQGVAKALRDALPSAQTVTDIGWGKGKVEKVASNRRYVLADGTIKHRRMSRSTDDETKNAEEGLIDPWLRALSFWNGDHALVVLNVYAVHPMSYYGTALAGSDFPGIARAARQEADRTTLQIYASGCSGNLAAGKYNDGDPANRQVLASRLEEGMVKAFADTKREPLKNMEFRLEKVRLEPRNDNGLSKEELEATLAKKGDAKAHGMAAIGLSWRKRADDPNYRIDLPALRFNGGDASLLLLPGEIYLEYQLAAQKMGGDNFVVTLGYGDAPAGYLPPERAWAEGDTNMNSWGWVAPGMEERMMAAIRKLLAP